MRINNIFMKQQDEQTVARYLTLIRDTLMLVPSSYDVARSLTNVLESLRIHDFEHMQVDTYLSLHDDEVS